MEEVTNKPDAVVRFQEKEVDDQTQDLAILSRWVKGELFDTVKFIYNSDIDLKVNGTLFKMFIRDCRNRLFGLKSINPGNQIYRRAYVEKLWSEATKRRSNLITDGLSSRRSGIYSAMQNRFRDLCNACAIENMVLPSIEAFEMRLELPCVYMVFYEYFLQASIGESRWKVACLNAKKKGDPLSVIQAEAFAMLVLKNNYFAWLWDAMTGDLKDILITDYHSETKIGTKKHVGKGILKGELNLQQVNEDEEEGGNEGEEPDVTYVDLVVTEGHGLYRGLEKKTDAAMKKARRAAKSTDRHKEFQKLLHEENTAAAAAVTASDDTIADAGEVVPQKTEEEKQLDRTKKRKVLKTFREYTNPQGDEGRFKGWSNRASDDMATLLDILTEESDGTKAKRFRAAYRLTYDAKIGLEKKKKAIQAASQSNYEKSIWRVGDIEEFEEI